MGFYNGGMAGIQGKGGDVAMLKFSNTGVLNWSTYIGGTNDDNGVAIACDANDEVWVTGCSQSTNFPVLTWGGAYYQPAFAGGTTATYEGGDVIMMKFSNSGVMQWSTYLGGTGSEMAFSMDNDPSGNIWVTGRTASTNFPLLNAGSGAYYQATPGGGDDVFVLKFNNLGVMQHSTYYGGTDFDHGEYLICDDAGDVYVTGATASTNFPLLDMGSGAYYQATHAGTGSTGWGGTFYYRMDYGDAFVLRFANSGQQKWGTFLGGSDNDAGRGLTVNPAGQLYVIGDTKSGNFPVLQGTGYWQTMNGTGSTSADDAFITVFSPAGVQQHATYYGGSGDDRAGAILADDCGHIYGAGHTFSLDLPTVDPGNGAYFINALVASDDVFFFQLDNSNSLTWSTYNGCSGFDEKGTSLRVDPSGRLFATGYWCFYSTSNGCYNPGGGAYYKTNIDADDFFIMKFDAPASGVLSSSLVPTNISCNNACDGQLTASGNGSCFLPYTYLWLPSGDTTATITGLCPGTFTVIITDANGDTVTATSTLSQPPPVSFSVNGNLTISPGDSTTLSVSGGSTYLWSDSSTTSSITVSPPATTSYTVIITDANGCSDTITVTVNVDDSTPIYIWIPNVFTPNGDGSNDEFLVTATGFNELQLWIYNRWGQLLYESATFPVKWNGYNMQNKLSSDGTYYWVVKGVQQDGILYENTGFLTLIDGRH
ncbi:MAG: cell surface protein [Bacteroidetes bacterium]|nr:MAG: cell surface protein [Bacteroidota bacterium]